MRNSPVSTAILIICVILYFIEQTNGHPEDADTAIRYGAMYAPMVKKGQYWRLVSACFVHFGIWHIIANMYSLYALGPGAEAILGSVPFAVLYLGSGFCGNLVTYLRDEKRGRNSVSAGASGAIFGLMGAFLVIALDPRYRDQPGLWRGKQEDQPVGPSGRAGIRNDHHLCPAPVCLRRGRSINEQHGRLQNQKVRWKDLCRMDDSRGLCRRHALWHARDGVSCRQLYGGVQPCAEEKAPPPEADMLQESDAFCRRLSFILKTGWFSAI